MYPKQQGHSIVLDATDEEKSVEVLKKDQGPQKDNWIQNCCQLVECLLIHLLFCQGLHILAEKETLIFHFVFLLHKYTL